MSDVYIDVHPLYVGMKARLEMRVEAAEARVNLVKAWLAERDRYYQADRADGTPFSVCYEYAQKTDAARNAFRAALADEGDAK